MYISVLCVHNVHTHNPLPLVLDASFLVHLYPVKKTVYSSGGKKAIPFNSSQYLALFSQSPGAFVCSSSTATAPMLYSLPQSVILG